MGKKTNTTNGAAPAKRAAKPTTKTKNADAPAVITPPAKSPAPKNSAPAPRKTSSPKLTGAKPATAKPATAKPAAKPVPAYTDSDVSLRAYYIAETRTAAGRAGDSHQDWLEAERQLVAEAAVLQKPTTKSKVKAPAKAKAAKA